MIQHIILDLDGPLLDGTDRHYACYQRLASELGFDPLPLAEYWDLKKTGCGAKKILAKSQAESVYTEFSRRWLERIEEQDYLLLDRVQPRVEATLRAWKQLRIGLTLATLRKSPENLIWQLERFGLLPFFDQVAVIPESREGAEKARRVRELLPEAEVERMLWIGDTEVDIASARALGCRVVGVTCGVRNREYLLRYQPDFLVDRLCEVDLSLATNVGRARN